MIDLISSGGFLVILFLGLVALAVHCDVTSLRIPNAIPLSLAGLYPAYVGIVGVAFHDAISAVAATAAVFVVGTVLFGFRLIGGGDVKLMAAISLWAGAGGVLGFLVTTTLAGGVIAVLMMGQRRFPFADAFVLIRGEVPRPRIQGARIPYALAIGWGAYAAVAPSLLSSAGSAGSAGS